MTPKEEKALIKTLAKMADTILVLDERVKTLEKEVLSLQVKELSREMEGLYE